ncbi:dnaJ homolog subfamily B member 4 [Selaginella moellendorffii]|nr:dnaJ homolog subfamily B member 4 [Selaginella moellendorffii]|eukprot:XP_002977935.2 dnaJ homolog subfamily B member 4 [Selaginella moellendorffii]
MAVKAVELAEKLFMFHDIPAARRLCVKALQLDPGLERGKQMLAVVEVHAAAEARHHSLLLAQVGIGDHDWYAILRLDPRADDATIRTQYKKMALVLHPDKNRMNGAEEAFKLVNEAWTLLSDKNKKMIYDSIRSSLPFTSSGRSRTLSCSVSAASGRFSGWIFTTFHGLPEQEEEGGGGGVVGRNDEEMEREEEKPGGVGRKEARVEEVRRNMEKREARIKQDRGEKEGENPGLSKRKEPRKTRRNQEEERQGFKHEKKQRPSLWKAVSKLGGGDRGAARQRLASVHSIAKGSVHISFGYILLLHGYKKK